MVEGTYEELTHHGKSLPCPAGDRIVQGESVVHIQWEDLEFEIWHADCAEDRGII